MAVQRDSGKADPRRPALSPPDDALKRVSGQGDALPGHEQGGFGNAEGEIVRADLGQLSGEPVPVQGQQRVHPR